MTRYIEERREVLGVEPVCRVIGVPVSTHYARRSRKPSRRELRDRELISEIYAARSGYRSVYGVRKTWKELHRRDVDVGRDRVARLMRREGLEGVRRGKKKRTTTPDEKAAEKARDLVQRDLTATCPNAKWVSDITYVRTWQGFCYVAFVLDCFSRQVVGWQIATHLRASLVLDALEMANGLRRPKPGLIAHSDRGSQYTSLVYTDRLDELEIAPSVGSKGDAYDNAMAESWVAIYKSELVLGLDRRSSAATAQMWASLTTAWSEHSLEMLRSSRCASRRSGCWADKSQKLIWRAPQRSMNPNGDELFEVRSRPRGSVSRKPGSPLDANLDSAALPGFVPRTLVVRVHPWKTGVWS